ncbi:Protein AEXR-1 [Aphelenchoides avenae]|nr:Protein AEXR-1 [Aphelenchus avenae]
MPATEAPGGVNVELKGDDLYINGRLKYGEKPSLLTRFVTVPRCVSKKSVYYVVLAACAIGVLCNLLVVCFAVKLFRSKADTIHLFILTMVIGDTILAGFAHPAYALTRLTPSVTSSAFFCNSVYFTRWLGHAISGLSLVLLNLDKAIYFAAPLKYLRINSKWAIFACLVTCILALSFVGSLWLSKTIRVLRNCRMWVPNTRIFVNDIFAALFFVLPVMASLTVSILLYCILRRHKNKPKACFVTDPY